MKKKIGLRRKIRKVEELKPLTTTGEKYFGRYSLRCIETWDAKKVTLEMVRESWYKKYHPAGYGTTVTGTVEDGVLTTMMIRASSCD